MMLKILQVRLQLYMNCELPNVQAGFRKERETRDQIANIHWIIKKKESSRNTSISVLLTVPRPLTVWITKKLWKLLQDVAILDDLICLLRNLYAGQDTTVRTEHGTTDWFKIGKGVHQCCILSPCLFNLYAEYIMQNTGLDEAQMGIKIAGRNINNLRYADDTTLMAESEGLKSLLMKLKEESEKVGLKLKIQKMKVMASGPITSWQKWGNNGNSVRHYIFLWVPKSLQMVTAPMKFKGSCSLGENLWQT